MSGALRGGLKALRICAGLPGSTGGYCARGIGEAGAGHVQEVALARCLSQSGFVVPVGRCVTQGGVCSEWPVRGGELYPCSKVC